MFTNILNRLRCSACGLSIVGLLLIALPAEAYVSVSSEIWEDSVSSDGSFTLRGRGVADGVGQVRATAQLISPSSVGLDWNEAFGSGGATADVSDGMNAYTMEQGEYDTLATGMDDDNVQGCQTASQTMSIDTANYRHDFSASYGEVYDRCNTGICQSMTLAGLPSPPPAFLRLNILRVYALFSYYCYSVGYTVIGSCAG